MSKKDTSKHPVPEETAVQRGYSQVVPGEELQETSVLDSQNDDVVPKRFHNTPESLKLQGNIAKSIQAKTFVLFYAR